MLINVFQPFVTQVKLTNDYYYACFAIVGMIGEILYNVFHKDKEEKDT
jgi:hypothetical protein